MPQSYFIWNNKDCRSMGIIMRGPAAIVRPEERVQHIEIPGLSGDLTELEGENIYPDSTPQLHLGDAVSGNFSERELEVLRLVVAGETDAAIAEKLYMSVRTVKQHIQSMKNKTGFRNRTELAVRARESGIVINSPKYE